MPSRKVLAIGAVALAGVVLIGGVVRLADRGASSTAAQRAQAPPSHAAGPPGTAPSDQAPPFGAAPTPTDTPTPSPTPSPTPTPRATPTPTPSPSMTPLTILTPRLRGRPGSSVTLVAVTAPRTACSISVGYSPAPQLGPVTSGGQGAVSWTWTVSSAVQQGIYQILVTCGTGSAGATITVI
jgi:hypothetical protein